jgi:glycosyltransferase involved in cell wall biosynthesis
VLDRLPTTVHGRPPQVLVADDASTDDTAERAARWRDRHPERDIEVVRRPANLGYGGNQKACFGWALAADVDVVVLLHADGQYPPERVEDLVAAIVAAQADAGFGSRMLEPGSARAGGMPLTRFVGNKALSRVQNWLTGARLSEWHSGFRAYTTDVLRQVDLDRLPDGFDVDTAMTVLLLGQQARLVEIAIPTHYGDELSRIRLIRTGTRMLGHALRFRLDRRRGVHGRVAR